MGRTQHRHSYYGLCKACTSIKGTNTGICARCASSVLSLLSANERHQRCLTFLTSITYTQQDDRQRRAVNPRDVEHASSQRSFRQVPCWLSTLEGLRQRVPSLGTCKHPVPRKPQCQVAADQKALCTADISDPGLCYTCPALRNSPTDTCSFMAVIRLPPTGFHRRCHRCPL